MARIGEIQDFDSSHLCKRGETMTASIINKTFKSIVAASAALIMATSVAACGPSAATPSDESSTGGDSSSSSSATARTLDEIKKSGELKVAVFSDKAPFGYIDKEGKNAGYDVYFAERLGKDLGVKVKYTSVDPAARVDVLTSNKVDITLANFTVTDERKEKVDFAKPYMKVALGVVSPENAEITDVNQLKGKTLIIAKGTTAESYFEKNEPDVKLQKYDQYADAYNALLDGRGDAFSTDNTEVLAWAKSNKGFKVGITKLGDEDTIAPAVQKGNKELLNWLNDEIVKLGKENFFHKDYEETLKPVYGSDVDPDDIVVEGGKL
jgi:polar amino acid transport system substrate-binding protein